MAILNICGFELGADTFSTTSKGEGGNGTASGLLVAATIVTSPVRSGQYALRATNAGGAAYFILAGLDGGVGLHANFNLATTYVRFYFRYAAKPASSSVPMFAALHTDLTFFKFALHLNSSGNLMAFNTFGSQIGSTGTTVLSQDAWYLIEIQIGTGTSASFEVKLASDDGSSGSVEISGTGNLSTNNCIACAFGKVVNNSVTFDGFFDDISISNSAYPGPGKVVRLDPISDVETWTTGTFENVDDYSEQAGDDTDTSFSTTSTQNDVHRVTVTSPTDAGITGTVNAVKGVVVCRDENQALSYSFGISATGASADSSAADGGQTYEIRQILSSHALIIGGLDTLSVRVTKTQSQSRPLRCTAMCAMVDYTPAIVAVTATQFRNFIRSIDSDLFCGPITNIEHGETYKI